MNAKPNLKADYYLANFHFLIEWIITHYDDLLSDEEKRFVEIFQILPHPSQCLLVRLASRKGPFFRTDKLCYPEIGSIADAAEILISTNLITTESLLSLTETANLLTKIELQNLFSAAYKTERKIDLMARISAIYPETKIWQEWTQDKLGQVYYLKIQDILSNFLLLFFGNLYQDLTEFVLQDLGLFRYENYTIDHQHRIFKNREELVQYQELAELHEELVTANSLEHLIEIAGKLPPSTTSHALKRRRAKICNKIAYEFERHNQFEIALSLYQESGLPPARERQIRLLEKQGDYAAAWQMLEVLFEQPIDEQELQVAERLALRLAKKIGKTYSRKSCSPIVEESLSLIPLFDNAGAIKNVEEIVRLHFESPSTPCLYVENQLLTSLFGLWLWPEIFRSLNGAFANPFQSAPLDLYDENFISNRPKIAELWQLFEDNSHKQHIRNHWRHKQGIANHFVSWALLDEETLELALDCIPAQHLKLIFERILFDIKNNRSGLPDLIQFSPSEHTYVMLEVKGPGDRIQDNQRRWLDFFSTNKIPAKVIYVSWE